MRSRLSLESLESRSLLAVDLAVVDVQFVDPTDWFGPTVGVVPVEGQKIALRAEIQHTGLSTSDTYTLRFAIDGVTIDVQENLPAFDPFYVVRDGWIARPDTQHTINVTIDPDDVTSEMNESNNTFSFQFTPDAPTSLPQKFINPVAGEENVDWIVNGYVDVDPEFCFDCDEDFRGNTSNTRDFHNGIDFAVIDFAQADEGVDVRAAADGTVVLAQDGNFDRWTSFQFPIPDGNRVFIDHGDGWVTQYFHLQTDSVMVSVGDNVTAGQVIGHVGSSGNSAGPHLHFEVQRNNSPVEPFVSPDEYFIDPADYAYDVDPVLHDLGITTAFPYFRDVIEQPSDNDALPAQTVSLFPWAVFSSIEPGDTWEMKFYRPDGTEYVQPPESAPIPFATDIEGSWQWNRWWFVSLQNPAAGNWRAEVLVNGVVVGDELFVVGQSLPELRVIEDTNNDGAIAFDESLIIDGRRTPLDFGAANQGESSPTKQFIVENHGFADLMISSVELPAGYSLAEGLDGTIAPGSSDAFTIALDTSTTGDMTGTIAILSDDRAASDLNADGDVDGDDFLRWQRGVGGTTFADGDINGDNLVSGGDLLVLLNQYASATETRFEFRLTGEVFNSLAPAEAAQSPVFDLTEYYGRDAHAVDSLVSQHLYRDSIFELPLVSELPLAAPSKDSPAGSLSADEATDVQWSGIADDLFAEIGTATAGEQAG
ncbi:MAG: peptidoglycan DD-metalloendopeptidase family protein [Planctomycetota bacterium]